MKRNFHIFNALAESRFFEAALTLVSLLVCFSLYVLVYDDYGSYVCNLLSGQYTDIAFLHQHYLGFVGVDTIYRYAQTALPGINCMGSALLCFSAAGLFFLLQSLKLVVFANGGNRSMLRLVQLLAAILFIENFTSLSHTRFSLLFCGLALYNLLFTRQLSLPQMLGNTLLFTVGLLHRPESGPGMLILVSGGFLLWRFSIKQLMQRVWLPAGITALLLAVVVLNWQHTQVFMEKIEPEIEYKIMDKRMVPLSNMHTAADSAKYQAARLGMWLEPDTLSPAYLRSLLLPGMDVSPQHALRAATHLGQLYAFYAFIPVAFLVLAAVSFAYGFSPSQRARLVLFVLFSVALVYALNYNGNLVEGRHFLNLHLVALLILCHYVFGSKKPNQSTPANVSVKAITAVVLLLAVAVANAYHYKLSNTGRYNELLCCEQTMAQIESTYRGQIILCNMSAVYVQEHPFSFTTKIYQGNTYIMHDAFTYSLIPEYAAHVYQRLGADMYKPVQFFDTLRQQHALYMSNAARAEVLQHYMQAVHHSAFTLTPDTAYHAPACMQGNTVLGVGIYRF
jgi:hypothetical protein